MKKKILYSMEFCFLLFICIFSSFTVIPASGSEEPFIMKIGYGLGHYFETSDGKLEIYSGMPVHLDVYLANQKVIKEVDNLLSKRMVEKNKAGEGYDIVEEKKNLISELIITNKIPVIKIGDNSFRWQEAIRFFVNGQDWTNHFSAQWTTSPATLTTTRVEDGWYLSPEKMSSISTGTYKIVAVFDTEGLKETHPDIWQGKVASDPIVITIREARNDTEKAWQQYPLADHYAQQGDYEKGIKAAVTGLQYNPNSVELHAVCGRLYEATGDYEKALTEIEIAVKLFYQQRHNTTEHPERLMARMHKLKKILESTAVQPKNEK